MRYTSIERYAAEAGLAVVMPSGGRSFYANEAHGHRYFDYVSEELPRIVTDFFRVSTRPEDTFVAGLSMGGYGAMKLGLTHPDRYAAVASLSGALDIHLLTSSALEHQELSRKVFGSVGPGERDDLFALLLGVEPDAVPPLHVSCGTEDHLVEGNRRFTEAASELGLDVTVDLRPGEHTWELWDDVIRDVIAWLPIRQPD
jgi:S-formylglutathione hydrolase FrmB